MQKKKKQNRIQNKIFTFRLILKVNKCLKKIRLYLNVCSVHYRWSESPRRFRSFEMYVQCTLPRLRNLFFLWFSKDVVYFSLYCIQRCITISIYFFSSFSLHYLCILNCIPHQVWEKKKNVYARRTSHWNGVRIQTRKKKSNWKES